MATPANWEDDYEWELINDDGFVYRCKKSPRVDTTSASASAPPLPDPAVEEKQRRERKKSALLKLKAKYKQEIDQWVHLSNTLMEMQQKSPFIIISQQQKFPELNDDATSSSDQVTTTSSVHPAQLSSVSGCSQFVDELLLQTEAQQWIIEDVERLCDVTEAHCCIILERLKKSFAEQPIWASNPHELMTSLCQD